MSYGENKNELMRNIKHVMLQSNKSIFSSSLNIHWSHFKKFGLVMMKKKSLKKYVVYC